VAARTQLDKALQELNGQIMQLGRLVDGALNDALGALQTGDLDLAGRVIEAGGSFTSLQAALEEHTIRLLTLQQPLGGRDLRFLTSSLSIAGDLQRMGDGAAGIAQIILRMAPLRSGAAPQIRIAASSAGEAKNGFEATEASILRGILDLGYEARRVLQGTLDAFARADVRAASYIWEEDDVVDVRYHLVRHDLMTLMTGARAIPALQSDALILQRATYLLWIAHKLERVADHSGNICERIIFIVEGETSIKHTFEA
jgi:phosphate transport system protein